MADAVPAMEDVFAAVKGELDEIASLGTVYDGDHGLEDDVEFIEAEGLISAGSMDAIFLELVSSPNREGAAAGEIFAFFQGEIRYWSMRTNDPDWSIAARAKAESMVSKLTGNPAVFRIGNQVQLETPETADIVQHGPSDIRGGEDGNQKVFLTILRFTVEARRWDAEVADAEETCTPESASCIIANQVFGGNHQIYGD